MTFEYSIWLYLTPVIVLIAASMVMFGLRRRDALLGKFAASRLLDQLTEKASRKRTLLKGLCTLLGLAGIGIALARPQYGVEWSERKARGLDIVFVLDSSKSMLATDMRPTRLDRAKLAVIDLIERLEGDRIGLVAFAGRAFLQTPPTLDYAAFRESLDSIDPTIMTSGGSDLGNALLEAEKAFPKDNNFKVIVLLTDGEDLGGSAIETAKAAAENGIKVYAIGIGTPEGEYLRIRNGQGREEFIRNAEGQPVRSQLDEYTLQQIAQLTGGSYSRLSAQSLDALYGSVIATLPREEREAELQETPIERFQWAISAALLFLVLEVLIRRRSNTSIQAALIFSALLTFTPTESKAQTTESTGEGLTLDASESAPETDARAIYNQAYEALSSSEWETAKGLYQKAIATTDDLQLQRNALYNMGHAAYQTGRASYDSGELEPALEQIKEAESLFNSVLEIDPSDQAAFDDLKKVEAVRKAIEEILKQQQEDQQSDDSSEDSEENQEQEQDQSGEQNQEPEENSDQQENQDSESQDSSDSQQGQDSQSPPSEGEPSDQQEEQQGGGNEQEPSQDPAEDIPQPEAGEEADTSEGEDGTAPQPSEAGNESDIASESATPIEGMSEAEASALLESLRGGEKLLPFVEQGTPQNRRDIRDW